MDWVRPELLVKNTLWITLVEEVALHAGRQDFVASTHKNSSKDRWVGACSIGLTIPGNLVIQIRRYQFEKIGNFKLPQHLTKV
jgi:hypothetical protein